MKTKKLISYIFGAILLILLIGEIVLREKWGFAHAPLFYASKDFEYMAQPNQDGYRFGNHYKFNSYSQRSDEPQKDKTIILGLGDSVIYGGVMIDQDSIATSIVSREIKNVQMLNISAGSWGPDNVAAYLRKYGLFGAKAMVLLVSSHDAYDNMEFKPVVGTHPSYPDKQYSLAWLELFDRYLIPRYIAPLFKSKEGTKNELDPDQQVLAGVNIDKKGKVFNPGFEELRLMATKENIPLIILLHADQEELKEKKYNQQGQEIIKWAESHQLPLYKELDYAFQKSDYRDGIHTNAHGQRKEANIMKTAIKKFVE